MATRFAIRRYPDLLQFLKEYRSTLKVGAIVLPAGSFEGELDVEIKLDVLLPDGTRVGPIGAQVVNRMPDGAVALRLPEPPPELDAACKRVFEKVEALKAWLVQTGQLAAAGGIKPEEVEALQRRVSALEEENEQLRRALASRPTGGVSEGSAPPAPPPAPLAARGFQVPDVSRLPPALTGSLADRSLRDAFMVMALEKQTGLLTIKYASGRVRWGFWLKGGPVGWRTEPIEEAEVLGVLLFRAGQLTKEQLAQSLQIMEERGCRQGEALIEMGVLTFPQLVVLLQKQVEFILQRVMADRDGTWAFHPLPKLTESFVTPSVRVGAILFKAMKEHIRNMPAEELAGLLRPSLDRYVFLMEGAEAALQEIKLASDEQALIKIIQGKSYRLRELFAVSSLSRSATASLMWVLQDLGLLEYRDGESQARTLERLEQELVSRERLVAKGTMFDRMDLHWICLSEEVDNAWKRLSAEYSPERGRAFGPPYDVRFARIVEALKESHALLRDDVSRRAYRAEKIEKVKIEQSAEMLAKKGDMAVLKGVQREALECFRKAVELLPHVAEYKAGLQQALTMPTNASGGGLPLIGDPTAKPH